MRPKAIRSALSRRSQPSAVSLIETAGDDEGAAVSFAHQLEHPQRARVGFDPLLDCADDGRVDDVQIGERAPIEFFGDAAEGRLRVVVAHVVEGAERRQSYADAILTPNIAHRLNHINEQPHPILDRTAISVGAPIGARINELVEQITVGGVDLDAVEFRLPAHFATPVRIAGRGRASPRSARREA